MGGSKLVGVMAAALAFFAGSGGASAATLKANYQLQGDRASAVAGAPELGNLGKGNRFVSETVDGTERQVLSFPRGSGLSLSTAGLVDPGNNSVVMLFRLSELSGYRRLLDFSNSTSDNGLYNLSGKVVLYAKGAAGFSRGDVFDDSYVQVALTNTAVSGMPREQAGQVSTGNAPVRGGRVPPLCHAVAAGGRREDVNHGDTEQDTK